MTGNRKIFLITVLMVLISIWHYMTNVHHPFLHILHRELYLVPVCFAAYWFGVRGGTAVAVISIILFLPKILTPGHNNITYDLNNLAAVPTFLLVGFLVGKYQDARKALQTTLWVHRGEEARKSDLHNLLLCMDNSQNALKAAQYVADSFSGNDRIAVTIMGFIREPSAEFFSNPEEHVKAGKEIEASIANLVEASRDVLLKAGFPQDAIHTGMLKLQKESLAAGILQEQKKSGYNTIVVGGSRMTKTEEFIFGNMAVKLVRDASCPVITVF